MIRAISVPNPYGPIFIEPALPRNKYDAMIFPFSHGFKRGGNIGAASPRRFSVPRCVYPYRQADVK